MSDPQEQQRQFGIMSEIPEVDLPPGGINDLTTDHLAMNEVLLETLQAQGPGMLCDLCVDGEAVKHCPTCKANLCHFCCQAHRRQKKTASHAVVDLEDLKGYSRTEKPILCPSHPSEDLTLFCEQCEQPVCRDCVVGKHRQHPYAFTASVIHKHGDSMRDLLKSTQLHVDTLEGALRHIEGVSSAICSRVEAVAGEIRTFADGYIRAIEEHRDQLLKQLEDLKVQKETLLHLQKAQLEQLLMDMRTGVEFTERLLTSGSDLEILITKGVVASRLRKLNKVDYSIHPGVEDGIQFSPHEKAGQCCGYEVFGTILYKAVDPAKCVLQGEDLHSARQNQPASFTLLSHDTSGEQMGRGGEPIRVTIIHKDKKDCIIKPSVCDKRDGTYHISYTPEELGTYTVCICVKGQHVQGSPFTVTVKNKFRKHQGVFHCCTFCSSGGQKAARCACSGTMPGTAGAASAGADSAYCTELPGHIMATFESGAGPGQGGKPALASYAVNREQPESFPSLSEQEEKVLQGLCFLLAFAGSAGCCTADPGTSSQDGEEMGNRKWFGPGEQQ
ncbi:Tripartite motif-containing protein 45 [Chelonia mydas]|uniref:RING-type E3 ubiquitin transferase n=1 Tax=Chelonia mydas TaxID=8469 RepID=M7BNN1_CHEMY|nr:Tripartite motif-containing protein 45 [Chelonia mydas]